MRIVPVLAVLSLSLSPAWSQRALSSKADIHKPAQPPSPMLPFTATFKTTKVQTLANGATITSESESTQAQDSMGRYYQSSTIRPVPYGQSPLIFYQISDPVAHTEMRWDSRSKKIKMYVLPPEDQRHGCWVADSGSSHWSYGPTVEDRAAQKPSQAVRAVVRPSPEKEPSEDLGSETIQGLQVHGSRWTSTIPAGAMGNDQPLVSTSERWWSDEYRIEAREITDDPRQGKSTKELTNFSAGEPDPALFQAPEGYEVNTQELHQVPCGT